MQDTSQLSKGPVQVFGEVFAVELLPLPALVFVTFCKPSTCWLNLQGAGGSNLYPGFRTDRTSLA
jgi:hypothetical protein